VAFTRSSIFFTYIFFFFSRTSRLPVGYGDTEFTLSCHLRLGFQSWFSSERTSMRGFHTELYFFHIHFFFSSYIFFFFGWAESYPVLSYPVLSFPIRSDLVLSGPILSFPKRGPMFRLSPIPAIFERLNPVRPVRLHLSPAFRKPLGTYHLLSPSAPGKRGCNADFQPFTLVS
jgi:hypothetical protein